MKRFSELTDPEVLALDNQQLNDAIRIEAIERGIKPPIALSEALRRSEYRGYEKPADFTAVYELSFADQYHRSRVGYLDEARALAAIEGAVYIHDTYQGRSTVEEISTVSPTITKRLIGATPHNSKASKFEEYSEDNTEFDKVVDECMARHSELRQAAYNAKVRAERKVEYLRLAQGNEDIARSFWAKAEGTTWPEETQAAA